VRATNYPDAHYNLGSILSRLGKNEDGAAHLREALRLNPDYEAARKRLNELEITR
jgi:tetratricopeptide (TPR) repeat protein